MFVDLKTILSKADESGYAIPAFNVYNMETVMGCIQAAEEMKSPIILQCYSRLFTTGVSEYLAPIILDVAHKAGVPVCFHLDHGASELETTRALRQGVSGVMIDASAKPFDENVAITKRVVETCACVGVQVEGEIGHVGSVNDDAMDEFTEPEEARKYVEATDVTALAVLVGNAHGRYKKPPKLDLQRVKDIYEAARVPLVLHGGSGIPDDQMKLAIQNGIRKINFATDLCYTFLDAVFEVSRSVYALDTFMKQPIEAVKQFAISKINVTGSEGKA